MKKIIAVLLVLTMVAVFFPACSKKESNSGEYISTKLKLTPTEYDEDKDEYSPSFTVLMKVKNYGDIVIELYPEKAPDTVANFMDLVSQKFYDGLTFHRVMSGFMIQGGDPEGTGYGGSENKIKGEFALNGVVNTLKHSAGVISMARSSNDYNSASSQFFIVHKESAQNHSSLDGQYAAFGKVIDGMDVVDKIAGVKTDSNDKPLSKVVIESIRFVNVEQ